MNVENNNLNQNYVPNNNLNGITSSHPIMPVYDQVNNNASKKGVSKKNILIILAVLIVAVGVLTFFYFKNKSNNTEVKLSAIFDPDKPILVKNDYKYGYIDSKGKIIIEPKYISAENFYNDYAVVKIQNPKNLDLYTENIYQVIDRKGNVMISSEDYNEPLFVEEYNVWLINNMLYNSKLKPITNMNMVVEYVSNGYFAYEDIVNNTSGIIDTSGKVVFSSNLSSIYIKVNTSEYSDEVYASITSYGDSEVDAIVSLNNGKTLYSLDNPKDEYISDEGNGIFYFYNQNIDDGYSNRTWLYFYNNELAYQVNKADNLEIYDYENQILEIDFGYSYETLGKTKRYEYYDVKNQKVLTEAPNYSNDYDEELDLVEATYGYKEFYNNGRYGLISGDRIVLPCEYDDVEFLNKALFDYMKQVHKKELVLLEKDEKTVLYDLTKQEVVTTFDYTNVNDYEYSTFLTVNIYDEYSVERQIVYNILSGKSITVDEDASLRVGSNYITFYNDNDELLWFNNNLEQIYIGQGN